MKLRLKGNSIRVRLDRRDLTDLVEAGRVEDSLRFGPGVEFSYVIEAGPAPAGEPSASYAPGRLTLTIAPEDARDWSASDRVGFDRLQAVEGGSIRVVLVKDFACLDRSAGHESDDAHAFPNPSTACSPNAEAPPRSGSKSQ
jgi:hypothetical protein